MPRGEEREPKSLWKLGPDGIWRHPDGWYSNNPPNHKLQGESYPLTLGDLQESLRAMRDLCAFLPDGPLEQFTNMDDVVARLEWHIKVTP